MNRATAAEAATERHLTTAELEATLEWVRDAPPDGGRLLIIVRRPTVERREVLDEATLDAEDGLVGDSWRSRATNSARGSAPDPDRQLTLMNWRIASVVACEECRIPLAGDQLYVDFDLSIDNAPSGTRLRIGSATVELTAPPHTGCAKFVRRFGKDAMEFVNSPVGRELRLRGANAKVVTPGNVRVGDVVEKV